MELDLGSILPQPGDSVVTAEGPFGIVDSVDFTNAAHGQIVEIKIRILKGAHYATLNPIKGA